MQPLLQNVSKKTKINTYVYTITEEYSNPFDCKSSRQLLCFSGTLVFYKCSFDFKSVFYDPALESGTLNQCKYLIKVQELYGRITLNN